jgi:hypothetical protein
VTTNAILTPFDFSDAVKAGRRRFWKQILPVTTIDYNGQKVDFNEDFHKDLELSHREGAYEQVPLVFADSENRHNMDPRNFGGEILDVQYRGPAKGQGTWALIEADKDAERVIKKNPRLGVSARIVQGINKADGRSFKRAINHVLLTMNPRVSGMEPWQAVNLSDEDADVDVVDLTAENYKTEGTEMGKKPVKRTADGKIDLSALTDEEFQALLDLADTQVEDEEETDEDEEIDPDEVEDTTTTPPAKKKKSKTKITVEKESEGDDDEEDEEEDETDLSDADNVRRAADHATVRGMQIDLAEQKWQGERGDYVRAGVPPFLLDLAEPILKQPEAVTLDLSEGESVNATDAVRKMLDGVKGLIDMGPEVGHMVDLSDVHVEDADKAFLDEWDKQYG